MKWLAICLLFLSTNAFCDGFFKYGLGVFQVESAAEAKFFSSGYVGEIGPFIYQIEGGLWSDAREDLHRRGSLFLASIIGIEVDLRPVFIMAGWGPALISTRDAMLSTAFQFNQDLGVCLKDKVGRSFGVGYKHISNAGIREPNKGRDFIFLRLGIEI